MSHVAKDVNEYGTPGGDGMSAVGDGHDHLKCCTYLRCAHPKCCGYYGPLLEVKAQPTPPSITTEGA